MPEFGRIALRGESLALTVRTVARPFLVNERCNDDFISRSNDIVRRER